MRLVRLAIAVALVLAFASLMLPTHGQSPSNCPQAGGYYVAAYNGNIDPGAADFMATTVSNAQASGACTIVFVLTTNGGDGASMESMVSSIESYQGWGGDFVTLIAPSGSFAFSAGSYIAEASTRIYMVPGTTIGSATPIVSGIPTGEENTTLTKDINAFTSYMQTLTSSNGRNSTATGLMVTAGKSYPVDLALRYHVIDGIIDSSTVAGALADPRIGAPASAQVNTPGIRSTLISILSDPNVSSLLFLVGVFAVLADIYHPTLVLSIVGIVIIAIALFGLGVFGASPLALFLMIIGAAFIFLEVKTQHGISATIGVVVFIIGFLLIFQLPPSAGPNLPGVNFSAIPDITYGLLIALGAGIVIASLYLRSVRDALKRRPKVNDPSILVGKEGTMESDLAPGGKGVAMISSEEWTVVSEQALKRGDQIRVKAVKGLTLTVEKISQ